MSFDYGRYVDAEGERNSIPLFAEYDLNNKNV